MLIFVQSKIIRGFMYNLVSDPVMRYFAKRIEVGSLVEAVGVRLGKYNDQFAAMIELIGRVVQGIGLFEGGGFIGYMNNTPLNERKGDFFTHGKWINQSHTTQFVCSMIFIAYIITPIFIAGLKYITKSFQELTPEDRASLTKLEYIDNIFNVGAKATNLLQMLRFGSELSYEATASLAACLAGYSIVPWVINKV